MEICDSPLLSRLDEPLARVHADGLEQPVAASPATLLDHNERLLGQPRQRVRGSSPVETGADANLLDGLELEPAGEDGEPAEQHRLVGLEQVVAPLQGRDQRLLACRGGVAPVAEDPEAVVESFRDRRDTQRSEPARRELERKRQPVEAKADACHVLRHLIVELEPGRRGGGACDEQRDGLVAEEAVGRQRSLRIGDVERRDPEDHLPRDAERFAACREDREAPDGAEQPVRERRGLCEHVLAVVEHEQQRPRGEEVGHGVAEVLRREGADVERGCDCLRHEPRVCQGAELDEHGTGLKRCLGAPCELKCEARLADAAGPRQREQPRAPEEGSQLGELAAASDERARIRRERERSSRTESGDLMLEFECNRGELVATALDPVVVPVLGQQLAGVDVECRPEGRCRLFPACVHCRLFELVDVDLSREVERAVPRLDRARVEGAPRDVHGLVEVVGGRRRGEVAPEHVHRLLAMEPVVAGESEKLHELARLLQSPGRVGHRNSVDVAAKPPRSVRRTSLILASNLAPRRETVRGQRSVHQDRA